jgi:thiol:disulfide interchange protein DsbA
MLKKLIFCLLLFPAIAMAEEFVEGKDYQLVTSIQSNQKANKGPVITEFFSYACPWCYKLEGPLNDWVGKLGAIQFERVPVVFKPNWELYAKAFYTAKALALTNKLSPVLFKAIQEDKNPLDNKQAMIDFFAAQGVDKEIAKSAFESSPTIDMNVARGMSLVGEYQINAVPAFIVNNKYKTDLHRAGSPERLFQILDYLIKRG